MHQHWVEHIITETLPDGRVFEVVMSIPEAPEKCANGFLICAPFAQNECANNQDALTGTAICAKRANGASLSRTICAPQISVPVSEVRPSPLAPPPVYNPEDELAAAMAARSELAADLAVLSKELDPIDAHDRALADRIRKTFGVTERRYDDRGTAIVILDAASLFDAGAKAKRADLHRQRTDISIQYGAQRTERKSLVGRIKALGKDIDRLQRIVNRRRQKETA